MNHLFGWLYPHDLAAGNYGASLSPRGENLKLSGYWHNLWLSIIVFQ